MKDISLTIKMFELITKSLFMMKVEKFCIVKLKNFKILDLVNVLKLFTKRY